jgi:hypothetical protein
MPFHFDQFRVLSMLLYDTNVRLSLPCTMHFKYKQASSLRFLSNPKPVYQSPFVII